MICVASFQVEVGHPSEVGEIFDAISYSKGASVIRMLYEYLGDEVSIATSHSFTVIVVYCCFLHSCLCPMSLAQSHWLSQQKGNQKIALEWISASRDSQLQCSCQKPLVNLPTLILDTGRVTRLQSAEAGRTSKGDQLPTNAVLKQYQPALQLTDT